MKILYAEDERPLSMAVAEILRMEGYEVDAVYDGAAALEMAGKNSYDAAIFDIMMPQMDGVSVLEKMRQDQDFTPVLLLTAKSEVEDRVQGLKAGADDYLSKPFAMEELVARVTAMTRRSSSYVVKSLSGGNVHLDCENNEMSTEVGSLILSARESALLAHFLQNMDACLMEEALLDVIGTEGEEHLTVRLYVTYLRNKLRQIHANLSIEKEAIRTGGSPLESSKPDGLSRSEIGSRKEATGYRMVIK